MARKKRGAGRGSMAASRIAVSGDRSRHRGNGLEVFDRTAPYAEDGGFTMRDEARNTSHNHAWDQSISLRHKKVSFVSGGVVEELQESSPQAEEKELSSYEAADSGKGRRRAPNPPQKDAMEQVPGASEKLCGTVAFRDSTGSTRVTSSPLDHITTPQPPSATDSPDSEEEVILFKGRANTGTATLSGEISLRSMRDEIATIEWSPNVRHAQAVTPHIRDGHRDVSDTDEDSDAVLADYIANMSDGDLGELTRQRRLNRRDLGDPNYDIVPGDYSRNSDSEGTTSAHDFIKGRAEASVPGQYSNGSNDQGLGAHGIGHKSASHLANLGELDAVAKNTIATNAGFTIGAGRHSPLHSDDYWNQSAIQNTSGARRQPSNMPTVASGPADELSTHDRYQLWPRLKKGAKSAAPFDVSDSELEATLHKSWQVDRLRKKEKKEARELLRSQGLLRRDAKPDHPLVKYPQGMSLEDFQTELQAFMAGQSESLALPPMDPPARKIVHEVANRLKMKSKSTGSGNQRRPVLYRTKQTAKHGDSRLEESIARVRRSYFSSKTSKPDGPVGSSRLGHGAVTVRDGEVVGGSAPELGLSNKGRTMLEKMGWSSGTALGAMDNKGIMQPIEHVVKRSKTGLG